MLLLFILPNSVCKGFEGLTTTNLWRKAGSEMWFSGRAGAQYAQNLWLDISSAKREERKDETKNYGGNAGPAVKES